MAAKFCFKVLSIREDFSGSFESADGEKYVVKINHFLVRNPYNTYEQNLQSKLTLKWENASNKLIKISNHSSNGVDPPVSKWIHVTDQICIPEFYLILKIDNIITIEVIPFIHQMQLERHAVQESVPKKRKPVVEKKLEQLENDMRNLLQTGNLYDVILTDGSEEIAAHKVILCTRSSVFAKMFQHPMKENQENRITIEDTAMDVLRQLLHFIYTGTITIEDMNMAQGLYKAADKYDVKELKNICSTMLKSMDLDSVLDTLVLADLHSDEVLKKASLIFISKNYSRLETLPRWDSFRKQHQNLTIEILSFVIGKKM